MPADPLPAPSGQSDQAEPHASSAGRRVALSGVLAALSRALDLSEGEPLGHSARACVIGMRLGAAAGLDERRLTELFHALLLKDAGGSTTAARVAALFGSDDQSVKARVKLVDWDDRRRLAVETWRHTPREVPVWTRARHVLGVVRREGILRDLAAARCRRGADIVQRLGFPAGTVDAIRSLDEHWDGSGAPAGLAGDAIPLLSRIMNLAQTAAMLLVHGSAEAAAEALRARRGRWFEPTLTDVACDLVLDDGLRELVLTPEVAERVLDFLPASGEHEVDDEGLDEIALAFAGIVDAKSSFLQGHSGMVADVARGIGTRLGFTAPVLRDLRWAALLRDIGMLGISSRIIEKADALTVRERTELEQHPLHTWEILRYTPGFREVAMLAALHHEKLDGSGYPWRRIDEELDPPARVLAVADVFVAALADRSFRRGLTASDALSILDAQRGLRLDSDAIDALEAHVASMEVNGGGREG